MWDSKKTFWGKFCSSIVQETQNNQTTDKTVETKKKGGERDTERAIKGSRRKMQKGHARETEGMHTKIKKEEMERKGHEWGGMRGKM